MYSVHKFSGRTGSLGKPLPDPYEVFRQRGVRFRNGGTSLIAGAPGSFKSTLALNLLRVWSQERSVLYFSADSDEFTVAKRLAGIVTDDAVSVVENDITNPEKNERYFTALRTVQNARFVYRALNFEVIESHLDAFESVNHRFPEVVFIDNLIDTVDDPTDWGGMIHFIKQCDILSRKTESHVCILHHASESWAANNPGMPPPSWAVQGKVNQIPRLVLTLACEDTWLRVACVKNTNGPQDPTAKNYMTFQVEPSLRVEPF